MLFNGDNNYIILFVCWVLKRIFLILNRVNWNYDLKLV